MGSESETEENELTGDGEPSPPFPVLNKGDRHTYQELRSLLDDLVSDYSGRALTSRRVRSAAPEAALGRATFYERACAVLGWCLDLQGQPRDADALIDTHELRLRRYTGFFALRRQLSRMHAEQDRGPGQRQRDSSDMCFCWGIFRRVDAICDLINEVVHIQRSRTDPSVPLLIIPTRHFLNMIENREDDAQKASDFLALFNYLLECAEIRNYRKLGDVVYEQRFIVKDGVRYPTLAWQPARLNTLRPPSEASSISTFVYTNIDKEERYDMWQRFVNLKNSQRTLVAQLAEQEVRQFPFLKKNRSLISFRNGIYDTVGRPTPEGTPSRGVFVPYEAMHHYFDLSDVSSHYIDMDVDPHWMNLVSRRPGGWKDIPTELFQSILDYQNYGCVLPKRDSDACQAQADRDESSLGQKVASAALNFLGERLGKFDDLVYDLRHSSASKVGKRVRDINEFWKLFRGDLQFELEEILRASDQSEDPRENASDPSSREPGNAFPKEAQDWIYIFLGRMLHDLGTFDNWQIIPFLKGVAGSGKSSIAQILKDFFHASDVGILSNNSERKFGLSALCNKHAWICLELKKDVSLSQAEFQSMVSGEDITIAIKNRTAQAMKWTSPGFLCGNESPGWIDAAGSIARRMAVFNFRFSVANKDSCPNLLQQIKERELAALIIKSNSAYREFAELNNKKDIWKVLPKYFSEERISMLRDSDPLYATVYDTSLYELWTPKSGAAKSDFMALWVDFEADFKNKHKSIRGHLCIGDSLSNDKTSVCFNDAGLIKGSTSMWNGNPTQSKEVLIGIRRRDACEIDPQL